MNKSKVVVRTGLAALLCWGIYGETGLYTTIGFGLIFISAEMVTVWMNTQNIVYREFYRAMQVMHNRQKTG